MTVAAPRLKRTRSRAGSRRYRGLWLFAIPAAIPYLFVVIAPAVQGLGFSFTNWDGLNPALDFIGLNNYIRLLGDATAIKAITNTISLGIVTSIFENAIGLALALALNSRVKSRQVLRLVFFGPVVVLTIVVAFLWQYILLPQGPLNQVLDGLGLDAATQNWLGDPSIALWAIAVIVVWQFSGYTMVIYLAGLQGVPEEHLEAASLDGAGPWSKFWYIIRPALMPAITVNIMLSLIRGLMVFDQIWVTTQGGPADSTNSLSTLVYRSAFTFGQLGYSAAMATVLALIVAILGIIQYRFVLRGSAK